MTWFWSDSLGRAIRVPEAAWSHPVCRFAESRQSPTLGISITGDEATWVTNLHLRSRGRS